ncbi:MAG TPA: ABC transporter ATP-binding protein [Candidatus Moranbacteria bacterium]|nr:ABC transporter ATP-binding protein [Candidatus Moranbacteria bacterium]
MIVLKNIFKSYGEGAQKITVLQDISLHIKEGEFVAIMGKSGSGKSTLMNIIGLLDEPDKGEYRLNNQKIRSLSDNELAQLRAQNIGFVFQSFNLLSRISARKQVAVPFMYQGKKFSNQEDLVMEALAMVGLKDKADNLPNQLSGGQQQRVAIARAIVTKPSIILADEPTGALDSKTGMEVMDIFQKLHQKGKTVIMVTHDDDIARQAQRVIYLRDGVIVGRKQFGREIVGKNND